MHFLVGMRDSGFSGGRGGFRICVSTLKVGLLPGFGLYGFKGEVCRV